MTNTNRKLKKDMKELANISDKNIDYSDIPELDFEKLGEPVQGRFYRPLKKQISIRLDMDVLDWFQHANNKYQSLINKVCREYMQKHMRKRK